MKSLQLRVYEILEGSEKKNTYRRFFEVFIVAVILINILVIILNSVEELGDKYGDIFMLINIVCVAVFTVEYFFRMWACTAGGGQYEHPLFGRLQFAVSPFPLIDVLAILPFYLALTPLPIALDLSFLRVLRLLRILRIAKIGRYSDSIKILGNVIKEKKEQLVAVLFLLVLFVIVASALIYEFEGGPDVKGFHHIPECMWWSITTLTTVGYGDVVPTTPEGKIVGGIIAVSGIVFYALPTAIVGAGFMQEYQKKKSKKDKEDFECPHCGEKIIR